MKVVIEYTTAAPEVAFRSEQPWIEFLLTVYLLL